MVGVEGRYLSLCVFFLYTVIFSVSSSLITSTSRNGSWLSVFCSTVNWIAGDTHCSGVSELILTTCYGNRCHPRIRAQASTTHGMAWHGGHALDHTVIWLAMSTFQICAQRGYSDVTRPFLSLVKGLVPQTTWHPRLCTQHNNSDQSWAFWTCRRALLLCLPG